MAAEEHLEVERKYDVPTEAVVPDLHRLPAVRGVVRTEIRLRATYYDTTGLALARAAITLRRRTGGEDAGWHLKLPVSSNHRTEVRLPLGHDDERVPDELLDRVRVFVRGQAVSPVTTLDTRRTVHRLKGADGSTLAEICDDRVTARSPRDPHGPGFWREWEVELVTGDDALLDATEELVLDSGAHHAGHASKLSRALGLLPTDLRSPKKLSREASTGDLLTAYLDEHLDRLKQEDLRLRGGDSEGVHQMRIATRRLRSALATYRDTLPPGATAGLRSELSWLGGALAEARDAEVMRARINDLARHQPPGLVIGPVIERVESEMGARFAAGRADADLALSGDRYYRLLDQLDTFCAAPGFSRAGHRAARRQVPHLLQADLDRTRKRHRAVEAAPPGPERDQALHEVRKAAKRLRYSAETAHPLFGKRARRLTETAKAMQDMLGEHQDTVVARTVLREIAVRAEQAGENTFTYGRLHALEEARAATVEREYPRLLEQLPPGRLDHWLDR